MTDTPSSDELLKAFPEWTDREEELWIDRFQAFSDLLVGARLDPEAPERKSRLEYQERLDQFAEDIMMAADLADAAVSEIQERFDVQAQQRAKQRKSAKARYQNRRSQRLESRK